MASSMNYPGYSIYTFSGRKYVSEEDFDHYYAISKHNYMNKEKELKILERNMLKLLEDLKFYEDIFEESEPKTKPQPKPQPKPKPEHPLETKMKKSIGKTKPYSSREPRYHMTEVARDWAS